MPRVLPAQVVALIDTMYPAVKKEPTGQHQLYNADLPTISALVQAVDQVPRELLIMPPSVSLGFVAGVAALRAAMAAWQGAGAEKVYVSKLRGFDAHPLALIRGAMDACPQQAASSTTPLLPFLSDPDLEENLRIDTSSARKAVADGEWKTATVLAGSVIEALLLWAIERHSPPDYEAAMARAAKHGASGSKKPPATWHLSDYIEVAWELRCISDSTRVEVAQAKDYRNLIHPGRARVKGQCDFGTAHVAVGAADHVIRDLEKRGAAGTCPY